MFRQSTIFGHTELRINQPGAKFDAEVDFDVRSAVAPPKPHQIDAKMTFQTKKTRRIFSELFFRRFGGRQASWEAGILTARSSRLPEHAMASER